MKESVSKPHELNRTEKKKTAQKNCLNNDTWIEHRLADGITLKSAIYNLDDDKVNSSADLTVLPCSFNRSHT